MLHLRKETWHLGAGSFLFISIQSMISRGFNKDVAQSEA